MTLHAERLKVLVRWLVRLNGNGRGSQAAVSKLLGISASRLSRLMSGDNETVPLRTVESIAQTLGIQMAFFLDPDAANDPSGEPDPSAWLIDPVPHHSWSDETVGTFVASMARAARERAAAGAPIAPLVTMLAAELIALEPFKTAVGIHFNEPDMLPPGPDPRIDGSAARDFVEQVARLFEWVDSVSRMTPERRRLDSLVTSERAARSRPSKISVIESTGVQKDAEERASEG